MRKENKLKSVLFSQSPSFKVPKAMYRRYKRYLKGVKKEEFGDFVDGLNYGYEMLFEYDKIKYFIQVWMRDGRNYLVLDIPNKEQSDYV